MDKLKKYPGLGLKKDNLASLASALLCFILLSSAAQAYDGNDLLEGLEYQHQSESGAMPNLYGLGLYQGYVWGVFDSMAGKLCAPKTISRGEILQVIGIHLKEHRTAGKTAVPAGALLQKSLQAAFPC